MNVNYDNNKNVIKVNTELPGGDRAARKCFINLTGINVPHIVDKYYQFINPDGTRVIYRPLGDSGHPKVEINSQYSLGQGVLEKITFK